MARDGGADSGPVREADKTTIAYQWIARRIQHGTYRPGHRLVIDDLRRYLDMGNVAIREALRMLAAEGWVDWVPNVGARVAGGAGEDVTAALQQHLAVVDGAAIALAAPRLAHLDLDRLERAARQLTRTVDDTAAAAHARLGFHALLLDRCPNRSLGRTILRHSMTLDRSCSGARGVGRDDAVEHLEIVRSIRRGDRALDIELLARSHRLG